MSKTHEWRGDTVKHDKENFALMKERIPCVEVKNSKAALFVKGWRAQQHAPLKFHLFFPTNISLILVLLHWSLYLGSGWVCSLSPKPNAQCHVLLFIILQDDIILHQWANGNMQIRHSGFGAQIQKFPPSEIVLFLLLRFLKSKKYLWHLKGTYKLTIWVPTICSFWLRDLLLLGKIFDFFLFFCFCFWG